LQGFLFQVDVAEIVIEPFLTLVNNPHDNDVAVDRCGGRSAIIAQQWRPRSPVEEQQCHESPIGRRAMLRLRGFLARRRERIRERWWPRSLSTLDDQLLRDIGLKDLGGLPASRTGRIDNIMGDHWRIRW